MCEIMMYTYIFLPNLRTCSISKKMRRRESFPDGHAQEFGREGCKTEIELISPHKLSRECILTANLSKIATKNTRMICTRGGLSIT
jgi:hypothetical protein